MMTENIDTITLGGQTLRVIGPVAGRTISEFTAGLKVGPATYDERLHAFWISMADFSGGVGWRSEDIRQETGVLWDNSGGVDVRRAGSVTLPPLQAVGAVTAPAGYNYTYRWPSAPVTGWSPQSGSFYAGFGSGIYVSANGGTTITKVKDISAGGALYADMISSLVEYKSALYAFPEYHTTPLTCPYQRATADPSVAGNWSAPGVTTTAIFDGIVFDKMLLGTCNDAGGVNPIIIYTVNGANWNINDTADAAPIWTGTGGRIRFVGNLMGPWGDPATYFLANGKYGISLYALAFWARKAYEIQVSPGMTIVDALIWNSQVIVTDGMTVYSYSPNGEVVREMGLPKKSGTPPCFQVAQFLRLFAIGPYLYCAVWQYPNKCQVWAWNGAGWSPLGEQVTEFACLTASGFSFYNAVFLAVQRRLVLFGNATQAANTNPRRLIMDLPTYADTPTFGVDNFAAGPVSYITPWFDGGFHELDGALYWVKNSGYNFSATETVKVEYGLDGDEGTWTQMVDIARNNAVFTTNTGVLYFKPAAVPVKKGIQFRSVRFRITLARGATVTATPDLSALTLCYDKKPEQRTGWSFNLDINGMLERPDDYTIGGLNFTVARLWTALRTLWNTKTLLTLDVPSIQTGMLVKLEAQSGNFEDFRASVAARGVVNLTCLEPIDA